MLVKRVAGIVHASRFNLIFWLINLTGSSVLRCIASQLCRVFLSLTCLPFFLHYVFSGEGKWLSDIVTFKLHVILTLYVGQHVGNNGSFILCLFENWDSLNLLCFPSSLLNGLDIAAVSFRSGDFSMCGRKLDFSYSFWDNDNHF